MIGLSAKIFADDGTYIDRSADENFVTNNASTTIHDVVNNIFSGGNPFMLGCSDFSQGATLVQETVPYFVGNEVADADGRFYYTYHLTISATKAISALMITFDDFNNQHPNNINIDGVIYDVPSASYVFSVEELSEHNIYIDNWNTPNYPLRIQGITTSVISEIKVGKILNLNFTNSDRADQGTVSFGIHSNSGSLSFIDEGNVVKALKTSNMLFGSKIQIFLENSIRNMLIGTFYISDGTYSQQGGKVELQYADRLQEWQDVSVADMGLLSNTEMNIEEVRAAVALSVDGLNITTYYADDETRSRWAKIWIKFPMVKASSFWAFMTKCCELTGSYISCDEEGRAVIAYGGGR